MRALRGIINYGGAVLLLLLAGVLLTELPAGVARPGSSGRGVTASDEASAPSAAYAVLRYDTSPQHAVLNGPRKAPTPFAFESQSLRKRYWEKTVDAFLIHYPAGMPRTRVAHGRRGTSSGSERPAYDVLHVYRL